MCRDIEIMVYDWHSRRESKVVKEKKHRSGAEWDCRKDIVGGSIREE